MDETNKNTFPGETVSKSKLDFLMPVTANTKLKDIRTAKDANISPHGNRVAFVVWA